MWYGFGNGKRRGRGVTVKITLKGGFGRVDGRSWNLEGMRLFKWKRKKFKAHWGTNAYLHASPRGHSTFALSLGWSCPEKEATLDRDNTQVQGLSPHSPVHSSTSPAMSTAKKGAQSSSDLPVRQGALSARAIRARCPQFRILIIGKANSGKTTILRKVCNAKPDTKPIIYDAKGKEVKVRFKKFIVLAKKTNKNLGLGSSW